jgi:hypothetical protein
MRGACLRGEEGRRAWRWLARGIGFAAAGSRPVAAAPACAGSPCVEVGGKCGRQTGGRQSRPRGGGGGRVAPCRWRRRRRAPRAGPVPPAAAATTTAVRWRRGEGRRPGGMARPGAAGEGAPHRLWRRLHVRTGASGRADSAAPQQRLAQEWGCAADPAPIEYGLEL